VAVAKFTSRRKPIKFAGKDKNKPYYLYLITSKFLDCLLSIQYLGIRNTRHAKPRSFHKSTIQKICQFQNKKQLHDIKKA